MQFTEKQIENAQKIKDLKEQGKHKEAEVLIRENIAISKSNSYKSTF